LLNVREKLKIRVIILESCNNSRHAIATANNSKDACKVGTSLRGKTSAGAETLKASRTL
jgi:hypothetical protein